MTNISKILKKIVKNSKKNNDDRLFELSHWGKRVYRGMMGRRGGQLWGGAATSRWSMEAIVGEG